MKSIQEHILGALGALPGHQPPGRDVTDPPQVALFKLRRKHAELLREVADAREEGTFWGRTEFTDKAMEAFNYASRVEAEAAAVAVRIAAIERHLGEGRLS